MSSIAASVAFLELYIAKTPSSYIIQLKVSKISAIIIPYRNKPVMYKPCFFKSQTSYCSSSLNVFIWYVGTRQELDREEGKEGMEA